jgi:peptidoglycan/LPS O-acetylase OafA/YrhL
MVSVQDVHAERPKTSNNVMNSDTRNVVYLESIHIIRGIAAFLVVLTHVIGRGPYHIFNNLFAWADNWGAHGVIAFFVVSGVVLYLSLSKSDYSVSNLPQFLLRRIVRIEPTYFASLLFAITLIVLMTTFAPGSETWRPSLKQILYHTFYLIPFSDEKWIQPVYWTLAVEFQFYIAIGLLFPLIQRMESSNEWLKMPLIASFSLLAFLSQQLPHLKLLMYAPYFSLGMLQAAALLHPSSRPPILASIFVTLAGWMSGLEVTQMLTGLLVANIIYFYRKPLNRKHFIVAPLWFLGTVSYSLYVVHQVLASAGESTANLIKKSSLNEPMSSVLVNLVPIATIAGSIFCAWLLFKFVEQPTMELSKRVGRKRHTAVGAE